jgi:hypothetical protein
MTRVLFAVAVTLLSTSSSFAQSYCVLVRQAVATYGYEAAKRHAMAHYTKEEVEAADRCVRSDLQERQQRAGTTRPGRADVPADCRDRAGGCSR